MDSARKRIAANMLFVSALAITSAIALLYLYNIIEWGDLPDYGYSFRSATGPKTIGVLTEHGRSVGIEVGDRVLRVNGKTYTRLRELRALRRKELGEKNTYLMERNGREFEVTIINTPLGVKEAFVKSGFPYLAGLCYVLIGVLVYLMKPHRRTSWIFFIFGSTVGLLLTFLFRVSEMKPFWLGSVHIFLYAFAPATILHLAMSFPEERSLIKRHPKVQLLPYLISAFLFLCIRGVVSEMMDIPKTWFIVLIAYITFAFVMFLLSCFQLWLRSPSEMVKLRSKLILLGAVISPFVYLLDALVNVFFNVYLVSSFNYYLPFFIVFPLAVAYSIVKHNLFDIDGAIRRTFGYLLVTVGIAVIYTLAVFMPTLLFGGLKIADSAIFPLLFALLAVFFFNLARDRIRRFIDRIFYHLEYNFEETVEQISEKLRSLLSLDEIERSMREIALNAMAVDKGSILLSNPKGQVYESLTPSSNFKLAARDPLIQRMSKNKRELTLYDIEEDPIFEKEKEACKRTFEKLEAALLIPIIYANDLIGLMTLGNKKSGKFYRRVDIKLLKTLANQGALAIENVRLNQARIEALEQSQKELEQLNRAKSIALDHLSHELKTPLSVIQGNIRMLRRKLQTQDYPAEQEKSFETLERQLKRLMDIQDETDKIIRSSQEMETGSVSLYPLAEQILGKAKDRSQDRNIHFQLDGEKDLLVLAPAKILEDVLEGLIRNAIENTPDEGMIRILLERKGERGLLQVEDFGVGITEENRKYIFDGLFHTQETDSYASKKPYDFDAGGKGLNLYRMKVYGQRFGFDLSVTSRRCTHIPTDQDLCPGRISTCSSCQRPEDCFRAGGTTFTVSFPAAGNGLLSDVTGISQST